MKRKVVGIAAAVVLAIVGTFALVSYVQTARDNAVADEELVEVYVIRDRIARGESASDITSAVRLADVPARLVADDALTDLGDLRDGLVAGATLYPGEQLLRSRFVEPRELVTSDVPEGYQELTIALSPERAVGGQLLSGDTVGVVMSFDPFDLEDLSGEDDPTAPSKSPNMTHLTFHKVLVTKVQFDRDEASGSGVLAARGSDDDDEVDRAPSRQLLVTLALKSPQVEQVVFAAEFGHIWLTSENADADESGTRIVTLDDVYQPEE